MTEHKVFLAVGEVFANGLMRAVIYFFDWWDFELMSLN
jgi:hypothetical protein